MIIYVYMDMRWHEQLDAWQHGSKLQTRIGWSFVRAETLQPGRHKEAQHGDWNLGAPLEKPSLVGGLIWLNWISFWKTMEKI